jgi:dipeptidyl aminopeptidase/acylaminoacyl peptidase
VIEAVESWRESGGAQFSFSQTGHLIYLPPIRERESTVTWIDRHGAATPLVGTPQLFAAPRLSPDGRRLALGAEDDIWIYEMDRDVLTRLTFDPYSDVPVWSPDGRRIAYGSQVGGLTNLNLFVRDADGSGNAVRLMESDLRQTPASWSSDGKTLVYEQLDPDTGRDIWLLDFQDGGEPRAFLRSPFDERHARLSPDDRLLSYTSNESGRYEVYVRPLSGTGGREQVSTEGGVHPVWSRDGRELYYRSDDRMMVVEVTTEPAIRFSKPQRLFVMESTAVNPVDSRVDSTIDYDVSMDGQRFVALRNEHRDPLEFQPRVVLNWFEELKAKVPAK